MITVNDYYFDSSDGTNSIRVRKWQDTDKEPVAQLQISHGIIEHIERYDDFARFMAEKGFIVFGGDHLGHGKSAKTAADLGFFAEKDGWHMVVEDIHRIYERQRAENPALKYFMLGHSMGSFLLRTYLIKHPESELAGAIISGTGQQPGAMLSAGIFLAKLEQRRLGADGCSPLVNSLSLGAYNKYFKPNRTEKDWLSRDEEQVDKNVADPLCNFQPKVSTLLEMLKGIKFIGKKENASKMNKNTPVLFFSGDRDPVGEMGKGVNRAEEIFRAAGMKDVTKKLYPDGRHEMLNEINREEVYSDVLTWTEKYI